MPAKSIWKEGAGSGIFSSEMELKEAACLPCTLGAMERELEECVNYAKMREQFGQPIGKDLEPVSHKIADMRMRIELSRLILYKVAWMKHRANGLRWKLQLPNCSSVKAICKLAWMHCKSTGPTENRKNLISKETCVTRLPGRYIPARRRSRETLLQVTLDSRNTELEDR